MDENNVDEVISKMEEELSNPESSDAEKEVDEEVTFLKEPHWLNLTTFCYQGEDKEEETEEAKGREQKKAAIKSGTTPVHAEPTVTLPN